MEQIFHKAQYNVAFHAKLMKQLRDLFLMSNEEEFLHKFILCLRVSLVHAEKLPPVERTLDFAAKFSVSLISSKNAECDDEETRVQEEEEEEEEEEMPTFLLGLFNFFFQNHHCSNQSVRFRICQFINKLLANFGDEAFLDNTVCEQISDCMMERLQDKSPAVRAEAVKALLRLQDPTNPKNCPITKAFIYHLNMDPSPDVRRAVLMCIGRSNTTLPHILQRIRDVKDTVRRQAYILLSKLSIRSLTIKHRECLLREGLNDRSEIVKECVTKVLLPCWLEHFNGNFLDLLHALDVENSTDTSTLTLKTLFKNQPQKELLQVVLADMDPETKMIPVEKLTSEMAFYWQCLAHFLDNQEEAEQLLEDDLEKIIPDLTPFCEYLKSYLKKSTLVANQEPLDHIQQEFVTLQLLKLAKVFDLSDELGRSNLKQLLLDMLISCKLKLKFIPTIVELLVEVVPEVNTRLQTLAEVISEIHEPLSEVVTQISPEELQNREFKKAQLRVQLQELQDGLEAAVTHKDFLRAQEISNEIDKIKEEQHQLSMQPEVTTQEVREVCDDPITVAKCLTIVYEMMQSRTVTNLMPQLRSLMQNFVLECLKIEEVLVQTIALQTMAVFCLLEKELAQQYIPMFTIHLASDVEEVCIVSMKAMFDILLLYGLHTFSIEEEKADKKYADRKKKKLHIFDETSLFEEGSQLEDSTIQELQNTLNITSVLTSLLDNGTGLIRSVAVEGVCKLFLSGTLTSHTLLSRLIILWYNPVTEGDSLLRQVLGHFFNLYAINNPFSAELLEQAFLPTIYTILDAPHASPLMEIDVDNVARFIVGLTKPGINTNATTQVHNSLAVTLCNELLEDPDSLNATVLLRALLCLELSLDGPTKLNLQTLTSKMAKVFVDKTNVRYLQKFQQMIDINDGNVLPSDEETIVSTTVAQSLNSTETTFNRPSSKGQYSRSTVTSSELDNDEDNNSNYSPATNIESNAEVFRSSILSDTQPRQSLTSNVAVAGSVRSSMSMSDTLSSCETRRTKVKRTTKDPSLSLPRLTRSSKISTRALNSSDEESEGSSLSTSSRCMVKGVIVPETTDSDSSVSPQCKETAYDDVFLSDPPEQESPVKKSKPAGVKTRTSSRRKKL